MKKGLLRDERGVEPTALKLLAALLLLAVGIGIGFAVYTWVAAGTGQQMEEITGPGFSVSVSPGSATIVRPATGSVERQFTVNVEVQRGYDKTVTLSYSPADLTGVSIDFSPENGKPTFGSTMIMTVYSYADPVTTTITVKGTGTDDKEKAATIQLNIT